MLDVFDAYENFFEKRSQFPQFKKKFKSRESFKIQLDSRHREVRKAWESGEIILPKLGKIKYKGKHPKKYPKTATIVKESNGEYFIKFSVELTKVEILSYSSSKMQISRLQRKQNFLTGMDVGINGLAYLSTGYFEKNQRPTIKYQNKLKKENKILSRMEKRSNNWSRQKEKVAKIHAKIKHVRKDLIHKLSHKLVSENQVIVIESLNIKGMMKNSNISKSIQDVSWGELFRQLEYKAQWYGSILIKLDRWARTSKTCSCCSHINHHLKRGEKYWTCSNCNTEHDRDYNASINMRNFGIEELIKQIEFNQLNLNQVFPQGVWAKCVENNVRSLLSGYLEQDLKINSMGKVLKSVNRDNCSVKHEINPQSNELIEC